MPFETGKPRAEGAGRKKGTPNKAKKSIRAEFQRVLEDPEVRQRWLLQARAGKLHPVIFTLMCHYVMGKPRDKVTVSFEHLSNDELQTMEQLMAKAEGVDDKTVH
jgi:hypothetical protein